MVTRVMVRYGDRFDLDNHNTAFTSHVNRARNTPIIILSSLDHLSSLTIAHSSVTTSLTSQTLLTGYGAFRQMHVFAAAGAPPG